MPQFQLPLPCPPFVAQFSLGNPPSAVPFQRNLGILQYVRTCPECAVASTTSLHVCHLRWMVGPCCVHRAVAFHGLPTHKIKKQIQAFSPSSRLTQRVFIAPVGVNRRNSPVRSSLPRKTPRIHLMFNLAPSSQWFRSKETSPNGTTSPVQLVLASDRTIRRSPGSLQLKVVHNPCKVPNHPAHQHMIRSNFCIVSHWDGFTKCSKLSLNRQICTFSTLKLPFEPFVIAVAIKFVD